MRILKSPSELMSAVVLLSALALSPSTLGHDAELVVPMGALAHAAVALEKATDAKALEIRLADTMGAPAFEAALAKDNGLMYMRVASPSDAVTEIRVSDLPRWLLDYHLEAYARSAAEAKVPLGEAIIKAEKRDLAPAIDAGIAKPLTGDNAVLAYFVETLKGTRHQEYAVDATTEDPESLYEPHTPVELARRLAL